MNRVRFEDDLGKHIRTVSATSVPRAIDKLGGKLPKGWIPIPGQSEPIVLEDSSRSVRAENVMIKARVAELEVLLRNTINPSLPCAPHVAKVLNRKPAASLLLHDADLLERLSAVASKGIKRSDKDIEWFSLDSEWLSFEASKLRKQAEEF